jgi:hypothetical protein
MSRKPFETRKEYATRVVCGIIGFVLVVWLAFYLLASLPTEPEPAKSMSDYLTREEMEKLSEQEAYDLYGERIKDEIRRNEYDEERGKYSPVIPWTKD